MLGSPEVDADMEFVVDMFIAINTCECRRQEAGLGQGKRRTAAQVQQIPDQLAGCPEASIAC